VTWAGLLEKTLAANDADTLDVYVGYAGWTPKQLEGEVELGAWFRRRLDCIRCESRVGLVAAERKD
jgi:putative AlgH/UPF0301 family transcriptional regulator